MHCSNDKCILLFVKDPSIGVKTRLAVQIGPSDVMELYKCFLFDLVHKLKELAIHYEIVFYPAHSELRLKSILGSWHHYIPQQGGDIGQRMKNAFLSAFERGYKKVVVIGSDSPDLPPQFIQDAFTSLETNDVVAGPAADGGYYLIGFTNTGFVPAVFEGILWSTNSVFKQTVKTLRKHTNRIHLLPEWYDVDTLDDLRLMLERNHAVRHYGTATSSFIWHNYLRGSDEVRL